MTKHFYQTPEAELFDVQLEGNILSFDKDNGTEIIVDDGDEDL